MLHTIYKTSENKTTIKRSHCFILSSTKESNMNLVSIFSVSRRSIESWIIDLELKSKKSLEIQELRGAKSLLKGMEGNIKVQQHNRNIKSILTYLDKSQNISICKKNFTEFIYCQST